MTPIALSDLLFSFTSDLKSTNAATQLYEVLLILTKSSAEACWVAR